MRFVAINLCKTEINNLKRDVNSFVYQYPGKAPQSHWINTEYYVYLAQL